MVTNLLPSLYQWTIVRFVGLAILCVIALGCDDRNGVAGGEISFTALNHTAFLLAGDSTSFELDDFIIPNCEDTSTESGSIQTIRYLRTEFTSVAEDTLTFIDSVSIEIFNEVNSMVLIEDEVRTLTFDSFMLEPQGEFPPLPDICKLEIPNARMRIRFEYNKKGSNVVIQAFIQLRLGTLIGRQARPAVK